MFSGRYLSLGIHNNFCCVAIRRCAIRAALNFEEVPTPKGLPFVGDTLSLIAAGGAKNLHKFIDKRHKELGKIFKTNVGPVTAVFISDPVHMRAVFAKEGRCPIHIKPESWTVYNEKHGCSRGLFFMDGEEWLHCRKIMNKLLLKCDQEWIDDCCELASNLLLEKLSKFESREYPNLDAALYRWSVDVVVSVLLGSKLYESLHASLESYSHNLSITVNEIFEASGKMQLISARFAEKYRMPRWRRLEKSIDDALRAAREALEAVKPHSNIEGGLLYKMQQEELDGEQIDKIIIDLLLGASDTTANTMIWALYLLSKNQNVQQRLRDEAKCDKDTYYVQNIVRETLRLYPAAPFLTRFLPVSSVLCGYAVPANTLVVMSIYSSSLDDGYFKRPTEFLPERWYRENDLWTPMQNVASLPFAMGARSCIGKKIADAQLLITLSRLIRYYSISNCNNNNITDILAMTMKPSEPVRLIFNKC